MSWLGNLFGRAKAESGDRSPFGDFWFQPVGMNSGSGVRVTAESALRSAAVFAAVRVLAETFAALPFQLYRTAPDGTRTQVRDHWLYQLLARRPNQFQNAFEWREMLQGHLALRGNAFNRILANRRGEIDALIPLHPDRIKIECIANGSWRYRVRQADSTEIVLPRQEVWHLRGLSSDGVVGLSPIDLARDSVGIGLAAQDFGSRFFANDARPTGGWIEHPSNFSDKDKRNVWRESWQEQQSGVNRGKTAVLEYGMKYHELGTNNVDSQFLETRKFQISEIARLFRVPPHMIGDLERATFTNIEQQSLDFIMHTMTPWAERWEASIEADLLLDDEPGSSEEGALEVGFDFTSLMRGDSKARAEYYASGILNGWMSRNEARVSESLNPKPELDTFLQPLNMVAAGTKPALPAPGQPEAGKIYLVGERRVQTPARPADSGARLAAVLEGNARRMARRIAAGKVPAPEALAEALAVTPSQASAWLMVYGSAGMPEDEITAALLALGEDA